MTKKYTLRGLARWALDESGMDAREAIETVMQRIENEKKLYQELGRELIRKAVSNAVYELARNEKSAIWNRHEPAENPGPAKGVSGESLDKCATGLFAVAMHNKQHYMDMYLRRANTTLRYANRDILLQQASEHTLNAERNHEKAEFFKEVACSLPDEQCVEDVFTETDLARMAREIQDRVRTCWADQYPAVVEEMV